MLNKLRLWLIKRLLKENDGYTFTGFSEGEPLKFYYLADDDVYYLGKRTGNFYYGRPTVTGWHFVMSRHLPWGENYNGYQYPSEPQEVDFQTWIHGILDTIYKRHKEG